MLYAARCLQKQRADRSGMGAVATPLGWLAFCVTRCGLASVRVGYANLEAAISAVGGIGRAASRIGTRPPAAEKKLPGRLVETLHWVGDSRDSEPPEIASRWLERLSLYLESKIVDFGDFPLDFRQATPFQIEVWRGCRTIEFGETMSYSQLAERIGKPSAARAVGRALAANPIPLIVPCHRVLAANGDLCGYSGYGGLDLKRRLLELEQRAVQASRRRWG